jgi:hypothetical protein
METIYRSPRVHLARSGYIVFSVFSQVGDMESLKATEAALQKTAKEHGRVVNITCMSGSTVTEKVPDDVKVKAAAILKSVEEQLIGNVMVITGDGIGVTILRAFMTAFTIFSKLKRPQRCVSDVDSALTWIRSLDPNAVGELTGEAVNKFFARPAPNKFGAKVA